jgi:Amt family ammonium transporter
VRYWKKRPKLAHRLHTEGPNPRARNVLSVLMQCFAITCVASLIWLLCGYSLAFTEANGFIGSFDKVLFAGITEDSMSGSIPETLFALFQMTFAVITPALIFGGFAERVRFGAVMLFSSLWLLLVYIPVTHWVWVPAAGWRNAACWILPAVPWCISRPVWSASMSRS